MKNVHKSFSKIYSWTMSFSAMGRCHDRDIFFVQKFIPITDGLGTLCGALQSKSSYLKICLLKQLKINIQSTTVSLGFKNFRLAYA
jgi:hypothetical protein